MGPGVVSLVASPNNLPGTGQRSEAAWADLNGDAVMISKAQWAPGVALLTALALVALACGSSTSADSEGLPVADPETATTDDTAVLDLCAPGEPDCEELAPTPQQSQAVAVFFSSGDGSDCGSVESFNRAVPASADAVLASLEALLAGPTAEEIALGASSMFSQVTAGQLNAIDHENGLLIVDFADLTGLNNASTSCGSEALLAQLNATVFQFGEIEAVRYQLDGSCDDFGFWLQRECAHFTRSGQTPAPSQL